MLSLDGTPHHLNKALEINKVALGESHPNTASSFGNAALMYTMKKDYDKALEYNMKALTIMQKIFGEDSPKTATYYSNVGTTYIYLGNYDEATKYMDMAIAIQEKEALSNDNPNICPNCGSRIENGSKFCGNCGKEI